MGWSKTFEDNNEIMMDRLYMRSAYSDDQLGQINTQQSRTRTESPYLLKNKAKPVVCQPRSRKSHATGTIHENGTITQIRFNRVPSIEQIKMLLDNQWKSYNGRQIWTKKRHYSNIDFALQVVNKSIA